MNAEEFGTGGHGLALIESGDFAADHVANHAVGREGFELFGVDGFAVAEDGDAVADAAELLHAVGDVDDAGAAVPKGANDFEDLVGFGFRERGGGFVEDEEGGAVLNGATDFDELFAGGAEALDVPFGLEGEVVLLDQLAGAVHHGGAVDEAEAAGEFTAEEDVLGDGEVRGQEGLLVDHGDAFVSSFDGIGEVDRAAFPEHLAAVATVHAGDNLHEGGFAGAVLAHDKVDLAGLDRQVALAECDNSTEAFFNTFEFEQHHKRDSLHREEKSIRSNTRGINQEAYGIRS
jgi:hypothetical protein